MRWKELDAMMERRRFSRDGRERVGSFTERCRHCGISHDRLRMARPCGTELASTICRRSRADRRAAPARNRPNPWDASSRPGATASMRRRERCPWTAL